MPAGAAVNSAPFFLALACPRAGSCVTAGSYTDKSGVTQVAVVGESGGTWQRGTELKLPVGASVDPDPVIGSVACTGVGACQLAGSFNEVLGARPTMVATQSRGRWGRARVVLKVPANAIAPPQSFLGGLSCTRVGSCAAVGEYLDNAGGVVPMTSTESEGRWTTATELRLPPNAHAGIRFGAGLGAIACQAAQCTAIGSYTTRAGVVRPMATETLP